MTTSQALPEFHLKVIAAFSKSATQQTDVSFDTWPAYAMTTMRRINRVAARNF
jgi:hypothetical protein